MLGNEVRELLKTRDLKIVEAMRYIDQDSGAHRSNAYLLKGRRWMMDLTPEEEEFLDNYRTLTNVQRLAIDFAILRGDSRLILAIYHQVFLGIRPGKLRYQVGDQSGNLSAPVQLQNLQLFRR